MNGVTDFVKGVGPEITVGDYTIREVAGGDFFIEHSSGEGMGITSEDLEEAIQALYNEMF